MMKYIDVLKKIALLFTIIFLHIPAAFSDVTPEDITKALPKKLEHPYLFFTEAEKPAIIERIENDPNCNDIMAELLAGANRRTGARSCLIRAVILRAFIIPTEERHLIWHLFIK